MTRENLMACGDGLNDRSMIAYAGVGVAMQNAEQPVKDCADYVTAADNDHDGVAEAVEKFILKNERNKKQCRAIWFYLIWNGTSATSRIPLIITACSRPSGARSWRSAP